MDKEVMPNDGLIVVTQLPVIEEKLKAIKERFEVEAANALSLACNEATLQTVKKKRAELTRVFTVLESKRKEAKKAILSPYEAFEAVYKECVTDIYKPCDEALNQKIRDVEEALKAEKRKMAEEYFSEYAMSKGIDFVEFDQVGLNITMAASKKSLKDQIRSFLDKVEDDLALIKTQDHCHEILVEYKSSLNVSRAITLVLERHKAIETERCRIETEQIAESERQKAADKVDEAAQEFSFAPPKAEDVLPETDCEAEKIYEVSFRVRGTLDKIKALKEFLVEGDYQYDQQ